MSKPDDIQQDVWDAAYESSFRGDWRTVEKVARAIMTATEAEREACAVTAETCTIKDDWVPEIAAAIRKRGE